MMNNNVLPKKWIVGEKMPCVEGTNIEFKESRNLRGSMATSLAKYRETLTGLLNVGGGYLILGVTDQGIIKGVDESDDDALDKFRVAIDILYGELNYKDGKSLDPELTSLKVKVFPLENTDRKIIVIEAINNADILTIQSGGGYLIYRLNASNYRLRSERIYRHRDVQGLVKTVKQKMSLMIEEQHNRHKEILKEQRLKSEKEMTDLIKAISDSLYETYRIQSEPTLCERFLDLICFRKYTF
jgi:predicted HTH transcriptional regulator